MLDAVQIFRHVEQHNNGYTFFIHILKELVLVVQ